MDSITRNEFLRSAVAGAAALGVVATGSDSAFASEASGSSDGEASSSQGQDLPPFSFNPGTYTSAQSTGFADVTITVTFSEDAITDVQYEVTKTSRKDYSENFMDGIKDMCSRIVEENTPYVDAISGATLCSNVIYDGVKDCMEQAGYEFPEEEAYTVATPDWLGEKPVIDESEIVDTTEADIVVVGGGNAGIACAVTAAEGGKKVVVIEEQDEDSMFWYGLHQIGSVNSQFCMDAGCPEIDKAEFIADWQRRSLGYTNPRLVKKYVDNSGEMVDWLISNSPQEVIDKTTIELLEGANVEYFEDGNGINGYKCWKGTITYPFNAGGFGAGNGEGDVSDVSGGKALIQKSEELGAQWFWGYKGIVLETTDEEVPCKVEQVQADGVDTITDGTETRTKVTGVIAQDADGNYHRFTGESIVLTCGGYGANNAMYAALQQNQRELFDAHGLDIANLHTAGFGRDGSGIKMGMWAGGSMDPIQRCLISPEVVYTSDKYSVNILIRQGTYRFALWLDSNMERFCDEEFMGFFGVLEQMERCKPGRFYAFFDSKYKTLLSRSAPEHFCAGHSDDDLDETLAHWLERGAEGEETSGGAGETTWSTGTPCHFAANTWEELFSYMGLTDDEAEKAKASIDRYNELANAGKDIDFGRDPRVLLPIDEPPFYGIIEVQEKPALGTVTLNGLVIDENQRVLDKNYNPIEGLYASGNNSGGRFGTHYSTPIQGVSLGMALTLGRVLGKELSGQEINK
jgi:fumarate reductase flavoprotein subunit